MDRLLEGADECWTRDALPSRYPADKRERERDCLVVEVHVFVCIVLA
jgi:hypothetical protein